MHKILFICYGNICRSPMAEFVFRDLVKRQGLERDFLIASRAVSREEIHGGVGNPLYPQAREELIHRGIPFAAHEAKQLLRGDYADYDLLLGMDQGNIGDVLRILGSDPAGKVHKLLDYAGGGDIADPWYSRQFDVAFCEIQRGCRGLLSALKES